LLPAARPDALLLPFKLVPNAAGTPGGFPMTDISVFVQQSHNFIVLW
jgi:hypothetical protein